MYWTPWARLMRSITPNTSVRPAAIRNSSTPSCSPLRICTKRRDDMIQTTDDGGPTTDSRGNPILWSSVVCPPSSALLHLAVLRVGVLVIREHLLGDLGLELAVLALRHLDQIEVLDGIMIVAEFEIAAQRLEVGLLERGAQRVLVGEVAFDGRDRAVDQLRRVIGLERVGAGHRAVFLFVSRDERLVLRRVEVGRPIGAAKEAERRVLLRRQGPLVDREGGQELDLVRESRLAELFDEVHPHAARQEH